MRHLSEENIEALVIGDTADELVEARRHLAGCAFCAERLEREAGLEELLYAAAESVESAEVILRRSRRFRSRGALRWAGALLLIAIVGLWLIHVRRPASKGPLNPQVRQLEVSERRRPGVPPGYDVECPCDYGRWPKRYVPCLDRSTTARPFPSDSV